MRVLQIISAKQFGERERQICGIAGELATGGCVIDTVVSGNCGWKDRIADATSGKPHEADLRGARDIRSAFRIARLARTLSADIVHAFQLRDYVPAALAARLSGARLVLSLHSSSPVPGVTRLLARNAVKVVAFSYPGEQCLLKAFGCRRLTRIPWAFPTPGTAPAKKREMSERFRREYGIAEERMVISAIGELSPAGGQDDLVLAAAEVASKVPSAFFVLVGKDYESNGVFKRKLRRLVKVSDLDDNFLFLDSLEDIAPLLAASSAFVSSSEFGGISLAGIAAMVENVPIASVRTSAVEEVLEDGEQALLSDPEDPVGLADNLCRLLADRDHAEDLARSARRRAETAFSQKRMAEELLKVYEEASS